MHTPGQVAAALAIDPSTLRRWVRQFRVLLSQDAGAGANRRYTDADLAVFQQVKALLAEGHTIAAVRAQLGTSQAEQAPDAHPPMPDGYTAGAQVLLLDEHRPELDALRTLLAAQQHLIEQQQQHIADQAALLDQKQELLESREEEIERTREDLERVRVDLDRAHGEHAALLADVRAMLDRLPRWVKRFWGVS